MRNAMGIIFTDNNDVKMAELTLHRTLAALPIAGRYRLIDFVLSNMVNSGIINIGVTSQLNYQSLMDHIGTGKPWDLNRKQNGLYLLPPNALTLDNANPQLARGRIDILYGVIDYIRKSSQRYVVLADCHTVCNIDFQDALDQHRANNADVTVIYKTVKHLSEDELKKSVLIDIDESNRVTDIMPYPKRLGHKNVALSFFIMERLMLERLIEDCVAYGEHDFIKDILIKNMPNLDVYGYKFNGYSCRIDDVRSYYNFSMEMLSEEVAQSVFDENNRIFTKVKDKVPTKYGVTAEVGGSMIADGCTIDGCVDDSMISRGVRVGKDSTVKNCIIMQDSEVSSNCHLENVILDKEVIIRAGTKLIGHKNYPMVIGKRMIV